MSILDSRAESDTPASARAPGAWSKGGAFLRLLLRPRFARKLGTLATAGYLAETGWVRSVLRTEGSIDAEHALPWATFPYIAFIAPRLRPAMRVFEFGAGSSTLYYARRVAAVVAVEHDAEFHRRLQPFLPANARVQVEPPDSAAYLAAIAAAGADFDLVVVDGRDRVRCVAAALPCLAAGGVIVLDDAERADYAPAVAQLQQAGFRRLDFWGTAPGVVYTKSTAVFYRPGNCLEL